MNGEPLPLEHGYPARLIVPGLYGYVSATKWLAEIELTTFDAFDQYWVGAGWVDEAPIKIQTRIDTPKATRQLPAGTVADRRRGVGARRAASSASRSRSTTAPGCEATLAAAQSADTWRQWYAARGTPRRAGTRSRVRATEAGGAIQTDARSEPFPSGATGQHQIVVIVQ